MLKTDRRLVAFDNGYIKSRSVLLKQPWLNRYREYDKHRFHLKIADETGTKARIAWMTKARLIKGRCFGLIRAAALSTELTE